MAKIYLIGTIHNDINGPRELEIKLNEIEPDIVLVEGNQAETTSREQYLDFLKNQLNKSGINPRIVEEALKHKQLVGFEVNIAKAYADSKGSRFMCLNDYMPSLSRQQNRHSARNQTKQLSYATLDMLLSGIRSEQDEIKIFWLYLRSIEGSSEEQILALDEIEHYNKRSGPQRVGHRDKQMDATLRDVVAHNESKKIVTITGYTHIMDDPKNRTFYRLIKDINPQRIFLYS